MNTEPLKKLIVRSKGERPMPSGKVFIIVLVLVVITLVVGSAVIYSNIKFAQEGTVQVVTKWGAIERIYTPSDGWFTTIAPGRKTSCYW